MKLCVRIDGVHSQYAAGTLSYLKTSGLPTLVFSPDDEEIPLDLSEAFVQGLEWLMLAQAQECCWQLAKLSELISVAILAPFIQ